LHELKIFCIIKDKKYKKYECGIKNLIALTKIHGVIIAGKKFERFLCDSNMINDTV